jgi:flavin-binding protein dodecin
MAQTGVFRVNLDTTLHGISPMISGDHREISVSLQADNSLLDLKQIEWVNHGVKELSNLEDTQMEDQVYKILELVGSSEKSIEDAIQNAITLASKTLREMKWFEVLQTRGHIENGTVRHYQVTLKVGFTLEK